MPDARAPTMRPDLVALVAGGRRMALRGRDVTCVGSPEEVGAAIAAETTPTRRYAVWSAARDVAPLTRRHLAPARIFDLAEAHRIVSGGWRADPGTVWAGAQGLDPGTVPVDTPADLFATFVVQPENDLLTPAGHLRPDAVAGGWLAAEPGDERLLAWADAALTTAGNLWDRLEETGTRAPALAVSESAAALLCLDLERDGLPVDRHTAQELIAQAAGPRPADEAAARAAQRERDARVLGHVPGREGTDLRNPAQVKALLASIGIDVPTTRKWVLQAYEEVHPVIPALLAWRREERIATTYGYAWLDAHVGVDDRLRGRWTATDGAAGRMTAQNGLHNLPVPMRSAIAATEGWAFVRADLGQIEPRVLAAVAGDAAFAAATRADDLYAPVAAVLGVERAVAKIAVLAAMYGQRSGTAARALERLERAFPDAMAFLDRAYADGVAGADLRTFGGRLVRTAGIADPASRGRYARNALIQGAAAELFKAWAATVRVLVEPLGAQIVLCLHDELLVHTPHPQAAQVAALVDQALTDAARRWSGGAPVRFVADTSVIRRWSEAK